MDEPTQQFIRLVGHHEAIFPTIQGEGSRAGEPAVFVRLHGCDFHCGFADKRGVERGPGFRCDTKYSWAQGSKSLTMSVDDVVSQVAEYAERSVVITGGNPVLQGDAVNVLVNRLQNEFHRHVTLETQGSVYHPVVREVDLLSLSPKLHDWREPALLECLTSQNKTKSFPNATQIKIVVTSVDDYIDAILRIANLRARLEASEEKWTVDAITVYIQPDGFGGRKLVKELIEAMKQRCEDRTIAGWITKIRLLPQLHKTLIVVP